MVSIEGELRLTVWRSIFGVVLLCHDPVLAKCLNPEAVGRAFTNPLRGLDGEAAMDMLLALNAATGLQDLSPLRSVGLHELKGDRKNQWAMTVNSRWRICFEFRKGDAFNVEIVDYHKG